MAHSSPTVTEPIGDVSGLTPSAQAEFFPRPPRHPLDVIVEQALDDWQFTPGDDRPEGQVIRDTLADPQHRPLVAAWLQEAGLS